MVNGVNGTVDKIDSNFMVWVLLKSISLMIFTMGATKSYISEPEDVDMLCEKGVRAVLNIMGDDEMEQMGMNQDELRKLCQSRGI